MPRVHAHADAASINRLYTQTTQTDSASLYVISAMSPATMCSATLYVADTLEQAALLSTVALIFHTL